MLAAFICLGIYPQMSRLRLIKGLLMLHLMMLLRLLTMKLMLLIVLVLLMLRLLVVGLRALVVRRVKRSIAASATLIARAPLRILR